MHQILSLLWQAGVWVFSDPNRTRAFLLLMRAGQQYYDSLSPAQKAKVDAVIRWGVVRAAKFTLSDVLGDVAHQLLEAGAGEKVAEFAQAVVVRGVEIGVDKALEEAQRGSTMIGSTKQSDPRVGRVLDELEYGYEIDKDGDFKLQFDLGEGRSQVGFINSNTQSFGDIEIREVYSVGCIVGGPPDAQLLSSLLQHNGVVKLGAWRISELQNGDVAIIFAAHIAADTDARTLGAIIELVLKTADEFEKNVFGTDKF